MEPLDLDGLERLARAATPGTWTVEKSVFADRVVLRAGNWSTGPLVPADAAFIAAANPSTVLRLVEMARLGEAWREAEEALPEGWRFAMLRQYRDTFEAWVINDKGTLDTPGVPGTGPTPAAALTALAAKLRKPEGAE